MVIVIEIIRSGDKNQFNIIASSTARAPDLSDSISRERRGERLQVRMDSYVICELVKDQIRTKGTDMCEHRVLFSFLND